jgi:hypothetical protein
MQVRKYPGCKGKCMNTSMFRIFQKEYSKADATRIQRAFYNGK